MKLEKISTFLFGESNSTGRLQTSATYDKIAKITSLCGIASSLIMTPLNLLQKYYVTQATNTAILLVFILTYVLFHLKKNFAGRITLAAGLSLLLSVHTIVGLGDGFAVLWTIAVPLVAMCLIGLRGGFAISLYFLVLLIVLFYTPLRQYMVFSPTFMFRYPILYLCVTALSLFIMRENYNYQARQHQHQKHLAEAVRAEREKVETLSLQTILAICNAVEAKDHSTNEHSQRVAYISCLIAQEMGWSPEQVDVLRKIALLHDIGKMGIHDSVLNKPDRLTDEEYEQMKQHTVIGAEILKELITTLPNVDLGAKYHHERYDGKGYPHGLSGEEIPLEARIIGVADAFDAMNSQRVYRDVCEEDYVFNELKRGRGTQFDPEIVNALFRAMGLPIDDMES